MKKSPTCLLAFAILLTVVSFATQAGPLSDYLEGQLIKYWFQADAAAAAKPATLYVALGTACSDSSFTELGVTGSYARVAVTANATNWPGPTTNNGTVANGGTITFPTATADWNSAATIGYWAIYDAASAGNFLVCAALTTPRAVTNGATPSFAASALTVQFDN